ncbi:MAG: helix-turn-helix transcriptional regulator [Nocardioidaceae bacterium]
MLDTSARLLRLLSLLQMSRDWTGPQLAERLSVTTRTVRNDVERLRSLGYPVEATPGVGGGYRLGAGASLPPLLLDDDEALAVAVGLRTAAGGNITGIEEASLRALAKLEQVLPSRLRHRLDTLLAATAVLPVAGPAVDADVLTAIAAAVRNREQLRFDYETAGGAASRRAAEPHRLVHTHGRWYLAAWDADRDGWRTFRLDRLRLRTPNGPRFAPRDEPEGGLVAHVERGLGSAMWRYRTRVTVHARAAVIAGRVPPAVVVEAIDDQTCAAYVGSDTPQQLALWLGMLDEDFTVHDAPELAEYLRTLALRYDRAAGRQE